MGADPNSLPDNFKRLMAPEDRQVLAAAIGHPNAALTSEEARAKYLLRLERTEQKTLVNWLMLQEEDGKLTFDWSRTDRKTTNRKGMPDFRIYRDARALLGEMKLDGAKLSPDQSEMFKKFLRAGTEVQIWRSAEIGIRAIKNWLWTYWKEGMRLPIYDEK
ncbi:MAG TPA: VRR-NUC domain-containing protein [Chthoniobacterales bacterium]|nr:VRR-NUC domain-containing protein [Chthoniobacterales bacterium]